MTQVDQPNPQQFRQALSNHIGLGTIRSEALRHELSATLNRNNLTKGDDAINSLNTVQLMWLVLGQSAESLSGDTPLVQAILSSAAMDGDEDILGIYEQTGMIASSWLSWYNHARTFNGSSKDLLKFLHRLQTTRQWSTAACLAAHACPDAISQDLLSVAFTNDLAIVWRRISDIGLTSSQRSELAGHILSQIHDNPAIVMARDVDPFLARIARAYDRSDLEQRFARLEILWGNLTRLALAEHAAHHERWDHAINLLAPITLLCETYPQACVTRCLALIEKQEFIKARAFTSGIEDTNTRLMLEVRIAQGLNDHLETERLLATLGERLPRDPAPLVQRILALNALGKQQQAQALALEGMERFLDQPEVKKFLQQQIDNKSTQQSILGSS